MRGAMEDGGSVSSTSTSAGNPGSSSSSTVTEDVLIRIHVPELKVEKCMQFHKDDLVWEVKQQSMANLPKELKEGFNYGLFAPPQNGRAGKFLDEERPLMDYPFTTPIGYLELKYKRRVYKMLHLDQKSLRALHTKASLKRFLEALKENNVDKVSKMCLKGLDPNFHCQESGETPLTMSIRIRRSSRMIMSLVNGGAIMDYRTKDGLTPMHKAVQADNFESLKTLLDLGASPNYRDLRGLTPLYYCVTNSSSAKICEVLLHDYASIGYSDNQGWQETHQACRNKLVQHLEHLIYYGADMNAQNASGNTPLHVCAVNNLEECARVLLFRGCDRSALNYANQTPYQVAVIAGNMELAHIIQTHSANDVVPYKEPPRYNSKRRMSGIHLFRVPSDLRLDSGIPAKPPSPSPSNRSVPPFSSASSLSETSTGSSSTYNHHSEMESETGAGKNAHENSDIVSDSSGVCTSNSGSNDSYDSTAGSHSNNSTIAVSGVNDFTVGMLVVCLKQYSSGITSHLIVNPGEILEVTGKTDDGFLECCFKGKIGMLPPSCVQEVKLRDPKTFKETVIGNVNSCDSPTNSSKSNTYMNTHSFVPNLKKTQEMKTVVLHRGKKGFGFVLRGAKAMSPLLEKPYDKGPAMQYLDDVDPGGVADQAGLKKGDYLISINDEDISQASHEHVVNVIKKSGDLVKMVVISPAPPQRHQFVYDYPEQYSPNFRDQGYGSGRKGYQTLPRKFNPAKGVQPPPAPPPRDPKTTLSVGRARARSMVAGLQDIETLHASMTDRDDSPMFRSAYETSSLSGSHTIGGHGMKKASIKSRPSAKPSNYHDDDNEYWPPPPMSVMKTSPKVYTSVAEMKKAKAMRGRSLEEPLHKDFRSTPDLQAQIIYHQTVTLPESQADKRKSLSQENIFTPLNTFPNSMSFAYVKQHANLLNRRNYFHNESDYQRPNVEPNTDFNHPRLRRSLSAANACQLKTEPPTYAPPVTNAPKIEICRSKSEYASVIPGQLRNNDDNSVGHVQSSFRPSTSAKLYASPQELNMFGYKTTTVAPKKVIISKSRSQSLPPNHNRLDPKIEENEIPHSPTTAYTTFRGNETETQYYDVPASVNMPKRSNGDIEYAKPRNVNNVIPKMEEKSSKQIYKSSYVSHTTSADYSSDENSVGEYSKRIRTIKKKKPSNVTKNEPANSVPSKPTAKASNDNNNFAELIAKKAAERRARNENGIGSAPSSAISSPSKKSDKVESFPNEIIKSELFNRQRLKTVENNSPKTFNKPQLSPAAVDANKYKKEEQVNKMPIQTQKVKQADQNIEDAENSSSGVSSDQEHVAQPEASYVTVIDTESHTVIEQKSQKFPSVPKDDVADSSESSDETSESTCVSIEERNGPIKENEVNGNRRTGGALTKNAVSLVKLPPPQESIEQEIDSSKMNHNYLSNKYMSRSADQDTMSTISSVSSLSSGSCSSGDYNSASFHSSSSKSSSSSSSQPSVLHCPPKSKYYYKDENSSSSSRRIDDRPKSSLHDPRHFRDTNFYSADAESIYKARQKPSLAASRSATLDRNFYKDKNRNQNPQKYESTIEESLQLIRMHMNSLSEVNTLAGIGSNKKSSSSDMVLAPPPEFSDASRQRAGVSSHGRTVIHISSKDEPDLPVQIIRANKIIGEDRRTFRNKYLSEWTTKDTTDWLEALFMPEYKDSFSDQKIDGSRLMKINNDGLINLGIRKISHRVKIERSLKQYKPMERIDL